MQDVVAARCIDDIHKLKTRDVNNDVSDIIFEKVTRAETYLEIA